MRRTSLKLAIAAVGALILTFASFSAAEWRGKQLRPKISFGIHYVRPYNEFDYIWIGSLALIIGLVIAALMFVEKED